MFIILTLLPLQDFFSGKTDFHFHQFLSNFFRYLFLNFPSSYLYNIFVMYFSSNSFFLKSLSSTISNFFYFLTSIFSFPLNSTTTFFAFSKSFSFFQKLYSVINLFYYTKYFTTPLTFLLFKIFSTYHFLTPSTSTGFTSSILCFSLALYNILSDCYLQPDEFSLK